MAGGGVTGGAMVEAHWSADRSWWIGGIGCTFNIINMLLGMCQ